MVAFAVKTDLKMSWRLEYTNHPCVRRKRRKVLEKAVAEAVDKVENLLEVEGDDGLVLGDTGFSVESTWLPELKKHHVAVRDLEKGDGWASLTFDGDQLIPYGYDNPETAAQKLEENGSEHQLYLIWWVDGGGWHGQPTVSSDCTLIYGNGRIAVYTYKPSV